MARTSSTKYQETYSAKHSSATGVGLQKAVERVDDELPASKVLKLDAVHPSSYRELEERVVALKSELSLAESNTAQQEKEKQALEHRHSALLEVLLRVLWCSTERVSLVNTIPQPLNFWVSLLRESAGST